VHAENAIITIRFVSLKDALSNRLLLRELCADPRKWRSSHSIRTPFATLSLEKCRRSGSPFSLLPSAGVAELAQRRSF